MIIIKTGYQNKANKTSQPLLISVVCSSIVISLIFLSLEFTTITKFEIINSVYAQQSISSNSFEPSINATSVYDTGQMILGNNIKHLVILIPNEAHESPELEEEQRHITQPYVPQKAVVSPGTMVMWFNGDVDHDRTIILNDVSSNQTEFDSGAFAFNEASEPFVVNDTGSYYYYEADVIEDDPNFVMEGTIESVNQQQTLQLLSSSLNATSNAPVQLDTVGTLMVPTQDLEQHTSDLESLGVAIDSTHTFNDLRGGDMQTLIVWGADSSTTNLEEVISGLKEITPKLPYG
jgi:plastocyanin